MMRIQVWIIGLSLVAMVSCSPDSEQYSGVFVLRDSAGISIAENKGVAWAGGEEWFLTEEPVLILGGDTDDPDYQFFRVVGVARGSDGGVVVADRGYQMLRVYGPSGQHLGDRGGPGGGPGEFQYLRSFSRGAGDSLLALDIAEAEVFASTGEFLGSRPIRLDPDLLPEPGLHPELWEMLPNEFLLSIVHPLTTSPGPEGEMSRPPQGWALFGPELNEAKWLGWFPGLLQNGDGSVVPPFAPFSQAVVGGRPSKVVIGDSEQAELLVFNSSGVLTTVIRWDVAPRKVQEEWIELWKEEQRNADWTRGQLPELEKAWLQISVPQTLPHFDALEVDLGGNIWIREGVAPSDTILRYSVVDPEGRLLGSLSVPPGLVHHPMVGLDIGEDYFLGVWEDELGLQSVRMYGLIKP